MKKLLTTLFISLFISTIASAQESFTGESTQTGYINHEINELPQEESSFDSLSARSFSSFMSSSSVAERLMNGDATDSGPNGYDGTSSSVQWITTPGSQYNAGRFNGSNSYILLPPHSGTTYLPTEESTHSLWFRTSGSSSDMDLYVSDRNYSTYTIRMLNNGTIYFRVFRTKGGSDYYILNPYTNYADGKRHFFSATWDKSTIKLYMDGQFISSMSMSASAITYNNGDYPNIGRYPSGAQYFSGDLQKFKVYDTALSSSEILEEYYNGIGLTFYNPGVTVDPTSYTPQDHYGNYVTTPHNTIKNTNQQLSHTTESSQQKQEQDAGDPVELSNGEFTYENTLLSVPGEGMPYDVSVSYRNRLYFDGPVGINWDHNYNLSIIETDNGFKYYNGRLGIFHFTGAVTDNYNPGLKATLTQDGEDEYILTFDDGKIYEFNERGKIERISDKYDNHLSFEYDENGLLTTGTDTLGRHYAYTYNGYNRLEEVKDFNNRTVAFQYFDNNATTGQTSDLKNISITSAPGFTKTIAFTYTRGDNTDGHNLVDLIDSKGQTYVSNTYEDDRVTAQQYGTGSLEYEYIIVDNKVSKNRVTNKRGIITDYYYDEFGNNTKREVFDSDESGSTIHEYEYDENGRLIKEIKPQGNGYEYTYDNEGNIVAKRFKQDVSAGNSLDDIVTYYEYGAFDTLIHQTNPDETEIINEVDVNGNIISTLYTGSNLDKEILIEYAYNSGGQLISKTDGEGNLTSFVYSGGFLTQVIQGSGRVSHPELSEGYISTLFTYDSYGNLLSTTDGEGNEKTFEYNAFNQLLTGTTAEGIVSLYTYDLNNNVQLTASSWQATGAMLTLSKTAYDILDNSVLTEQYIDENTILTGQTVYDNNGNISSTTLLSGGVPYLITEYEYNEFDLPLTTILKKAGSSSGEWLVTKYTYDRNNNIISKAVGHPEQSSPAIVGEGYSLTTYEYDLFDRLIKVSDEEGNYVSYTYNKNGNILEKKSYDDNDVLLAKEVYEYDGLGNLTTSYAFSDVSTGANSVTTLTYDKNNKILSKEITSVIPTATEGSLTTFEYDEYGRKIKQTIGTGEASIQTLYSYDKNNNLINEATSSVIPSAAKGSGQVRSYVYDDDNRLISKTIGTGGTTQTTSYEYNTLNQLIKVIDGNDNETLYTYDLLGRKLSTVIPTETEGSQTISYEYDLLGNLSKITDQNGNETLYTYDIFGRLLSTVSHAESSSASLDPVSHVTTYTYDILGNLLTTTDPNGTVVTNTYDSLDRLISRNIVLGTGVGGLTGETYSYDALGRLLTGSDNLGSIVGFNYDDLGRLIHERQSHPESIQDGLHEGSLSYDYDALNNITSILTPSGKLQTFDYDALQRPTTVSYDSEVVKTYVYSGMYLIAEATANRQEATEFSYDSLGRINSLNNGIKNYAYNYDDVGNILGDGEKEYSYDDIYRLIYSTGLINNESFNYDPAGNRINSITTASPSVIPTTAEGSKDYTTNDLNQYTNVTGSDSRNFTYDNNGNLIDNGTYAFQYDYQNRLIKVYTGESTIAEYKYDVLGRRISAVVSHPEQSSPAIVGEGYSLTTYIFSDKNIIQETKTVGGLTYTKNYINGLGVDNLIAYDTDEVNLSSQEQQELSFCNNRVLSYTGEFVQYGWTGIVERCDILALSGQDLITKRYYYHKDHLGNITGLSNASGDVVIQYDYDAFGKAYVSLGSGEYVSIELYTGNDYNNSRLFTSREYDKVSNLYYYRARYYDADLGRFISRDPIGQSDDVNLYSYVKNNPISFVDPLGLAAKEIVKRFKQVDTSIGALKDATGLFGAVDWIAGEQNDYYQLSPLLNFAFILNNLGYTSNDIAYNGAFRDQYEIGDSNEMYLKGDQNSIYSKVGIGETANVLVGYTAAKAGFTQGYLEGGAILFNEATGLGNGLEGEYLDSILYGYGYKLAEYDNLTEDLLIDTLIEAYNARKMAKLLLNQ